MSKVEQIFKSADFSEETDLKNRLRAQLFRNNDTLSFGRSSRKGVARELSLDELDMVAAGRDIHTQKKNSAAGGMSGTPDTALSGDLLRQNRSPIAEELLKPWTDTLPGNLAGKDEKK